MKEIKINRNVLLNALAEYQKSRYFPHVDTEIFSETCTKYRSLLVCGAATLDIPAGIPYFLIRQALRNRLPHTEGKEQDCCKQAVDELRRLEQDEQYDADDAAAKLKASDTPFIRLVITDEEAILVTESAVRISSGTSGKTTMLKAILAFVPNADEMFPKRYVQKP